MWNYYVCRHLVVNREECFVSLVGRYSAPRRKAAIARPPDRETAEEMLVWQLIGEDMKAGNVTRKTGNETTLSSK